MLREASPLSAPELAAALAAHRFHTSVFILPPWREIYTTDAERDHSFPWVERVHSQLVQWYRSCGYVLHEVPRSPAAERARLSFECLHMGRRLTPRCTPTRYGWLRQPPRAGELKR